MAVWALRQLMDAKEYRDLSLAHAPSETDASVIAEWGDL